MNYNKYKLRLIFKYIIILNYQREALRVFWLLLTQYGYSEKNNANQHTIKSRLYDYNLDRNFLLAKFDFVDLINAEE